MGSVIDLLVSLPQRWVLSFVLSALPTLMVAIFAVFVMQRIETSRFDSRKTNPKWSAGYRKKRYLDLCSCVPFCWTTMGLIPYLIYCLGTLLDIWAAVILVPLGVLMVVAYWFGSGTMVSIRTHDNVSAKDKAKAYLSNALSVVVFVVVALLISHATISRISVDESPRMALDSTSFPVSETLNQVLQQ